MLQTSGSVLNLLSHRKWKVLTIINNRVYSCNEQKCAENNAIHNPHTHLNLKNNSIINMFVCRMRLIDDDMFEISFSRPCSVCCNMLRAIGRKGKKIRVKWSTGDVNRLTTSYINIDEFTHATPSSGTRNRYRNKRN
jgi:hypothetical protein